MILLDLFSGMGGFHLGLENAGFKFRRVFFSEIDKHAIANYKHNFQDAEHIGSVESILNSGIDRPNIITFGSPCQDFSLAGKRAGLEGDRSSLIEYALASISHYKPEIFIWENVKGTFSSNGGRDFWAIIQAFANIGEYELEWQLVNTSWILPQNRERIYLVGRLASAFRNWEPVFPFRESDKDFNRTNTTNGDRTETKICGAITTRYGGRQTDTYILTEPIHKHGEERTYKNVAPTITTRYGTGGNNIPYVNNIRKLTEVECERLQGYPDNWTQYGVFDGTIKSIARSQRYKMIGNAVTAKMVELIGKRIINNFER